MIDAATLDAGRALGAFLDELGLPWWVAGSYSLRLHGLDRDPVDLDLATCWRDDASGPLADFLGRRGWLSFWVYEGDATLRSVHAHPTPDAKVDLFVRDDDAPEAGRLAALGGWPVHSLEDAALVKDRWRRDSHEWAKHDRDVREILARPGLDREYLAARGFLEEFARP